MLPASLREELTARISNAVTNREAAVDVLKSLQAHYGWLTDEAMAEAAAMLDCKRTDPIVTDFQRGYYAQHS